MARSITGHQFCLIMLSAFSLVVVAAGDATAETTWYVDDDAPGDFSTIQAALDAASDGDTIIVRDGTYTGAGNRDIDFGGRAVHLRSENGAATCIIDAEGSEAEPHRGFYFHSGEDANSIVDGFTIRNGYAATSTWLDTEGRRGGGIYCWSSSPTISNNTITENTAHWNGGGISCSSGSSPTITNNTITGNTADQSGGGIYCRDSSPTIANNTITANTADYIGAIYCAGSSLATITNNTITGNTANWFGGGIYCSDPSTTITGCILWGNGDDLYGVSPTYSCIQDGDSGEGNISSYPYFADPGSGDYRLLPRSPCIDAGDPAFAAQPGETDLDGNPRIIGGRLDMGAYEAATKSPDADGDGLPDDWETEHFGDTSALADGDPDGDGLTNQEEYARATDPNRDARTIYVSASNAGDPLADGSLEHPYTSIQQGVDASTESVLVAVGTYTDLIRLDGKTLEILGGHDPAFTERDPATHVTVIDAAGEGSCVRYLGCPAGTLDGFTITGGNGPNGGGVHCSESSPLITNNTITGNAATNGLGGGGIYCWYSSPTITNNIIAGNIADDPGGGICTRQSSSPTIADNTITGNTAPNGGGIYCDGSSPVAITNNTITGNRATYGMGGGGIYCANSSASVINNTITDNIANKEGGGIYCGSSTPSIINNTIAGNTALDGGGIYCRQASPAIIKNTIIGNAAQSGGGMRLYESSPTIANNAIIANSAAAKGGAIFAHRSSPTITNNTITGNAALDEGGGIRASMSSLTITNCILWANDDDLYNCSATYSCIQDGDAGEGNISSYPHVADPAAGDYRLLPWSPCIDAGDPAFAAQPGETDLNGNPRVVGGRVDMGACEAPAKSPDADADGLPDDWETEHFGGTSAVADGDPDADGLTNQQEYELGTDPNRDARTIYVSAGNAEDPLADGSVDHPYASIQQGIDISTDTVLVAEGVYAEQILISRKTLHILGGYDPAFTQRDPVSYITVIDAAGGGPAVRYFDCPAGSLDGFRVTGTEAPYGGVYCLDSSPEITNNTITGNTASGFTATTPRRQSSTTQLKATRPFALAAAYTAADPHLPSATTRSRPTRRAMAEAYTAATTPRRQSRTTRSWATRH